MLTSILFTIAALFLGLVEIISSGITFALPAFAQSSVTTLLNYAQYTQGFFPVAGTLQLIGFALLVLGGMFTLRFILWIIGFVPGIGHHPLSHVEQRGAVAEHRRFEKMMK